MSEPEATVALSFNPRPRAEGDPFGMVPYGQFAVSIHAPARRATSASVAGSMRPCLFQSTPPRGGRP